MNLIESQDYKIRVRRSNKEDSIHLELFKVQFYKEILVIIPFELVSILEIESSTNVKIGSSNTSRNYLIIKNYNQLDYLELTILCKFKYYDDRFLDIKFLLPAEDNFNQIPKSDSFDEPNNQVEIVNALNLTKENFESLQTLPHFIKFLVKSEAELLEAKRIYISLNLEKVEIFDLNSNLKYKIRNMSDFDVISQDLSKETNYLVNLISFDEDLIPSFYIYRESIPKNLTIGSNRLIYKNNDFEKSYQKQLYYIYSTNNYSQTPQNHPLQLDEKSTLLINPLKNTEAFYLPIFTNQNENFLRLKKKFEERRIHIDGEFKFDFFAYTTDYDLRDIAEKNLKPFFERLFKEKLTENKGLNLVSLGVEYFKNGAVKDVTIKNSDFHNKELINDIKTTIFETKLAEYKSNYYVIYFFETYFTSS